VENEFWLFEVRESKTLREEVSKDWRKLYNEELHNLYSLHMFLGRLN
jgi:hypothetical protein